MKTRSLSYLSVFLLGACAGPTPAPSLAPAGATASGATLPGAAPPASPPPKRPRPAWMDRSDTNAKVLLDLEGRFSPEGATRAGVESADPEIIDLTPGFRDRQRAAKRAAQADLETRRGQETDPLVREDLSILVHSVDLELRTLDTSERKMVPLWPVARIVFGGIRGLLDEQTAASRHPAALVRLQRYTATGAFAGKTARPLTDLAEADTLAAMAKPGLTMPARAEVDKLIGTSDTSREGVVKLLQTYKMDGSPEAKQALLALKMQLESYASFLRDRVLPRARTTVALPPDVYALRLEQAGVDLPASELSVMAHREFLSIQEALVPVAAEVAKARNLPSIDYRDVLRALKKEQIVGDAILPHYRARLAEIEGIIREHELVALPTGPARMRIASAAESAAQPAPSMMPPRFVGNTGETGEFILPLSIPAPTGKAGPQAGVAPQQYDDFTYAAASWTLTAHELRPGHELQFDTMVEKGVPLARSRYAFNSANVEGWGLYSEWMMLPYMPAEGKLVSLVFRLQRAARAFLDPELQEGKQTFDSTRAFLEKEVGLSPAFATAEAERYTFLMPGQATSYFYGFVRLRALRKEAEEKLGGRFSARAFHDAILDQGLLPPDLMRVAVLGALGVPVK